MQLNRLKLSLKEKQLETSTGDALADVQQEIEWITQDARYIQTEIGYDKRNVQAWENQLQRL
jgi:hypothetical protein